ncbi:hypothetical protein SALBM135S_01391 [Streptomyces alboniger]
MLSRGEGPRLLGPAGAASRRPETAEGDVLAALEAEPLVEGDGAGVRLGHMQERPLAPGQDAVGHGAHQPGGVSWPRASGAVRTALISVKPVGRSRSPAIATRRPWARMPR